MDELIIFLSFDFFKLKKKKKKKKKKFYFNNNNNKILLKCMEIFNKFNRLKLF